MHLALSVGLFYTKRDGREELEQLLFLHRAAFLPSLRYHFFKRLATCQWTHHVVPVLIKLMILLVVTLNDFVDEGVLERLLVSRLG